MSVLVTGCTGFLGRLIVLYYRKNLDEICHGIGSSGPENSPFHFLDSYTRLRLPASEVDDIIARIRPRLVIHAAGRSSVLLSVKDPKSDYDSGPPAVYQLLNSIRLYSPETKFIFLSSAAVYGEVDHIPISERVAPNPISPYGFHKLQSEIIVREFAQVYGIHAASGRIFSAYGPGLRRQFLWDLCCKASSGSGHVELQGSGAETRDFIYGHDVCHAIRCIDASAPLQGEIINICSGSSVSISDLAHQLVSCLSISVDIEFTGKLPVGVPVAWQGDNSLLQSMNFMQSVSLDEGLNRYAQWFTSNT